MCILYLYVYFVFRYPSYILHHLCLLPINEEARSHKARCLLYLNYLLKAKGFSSRDLQKRGKVSYFHLTFFPKNHTTKSIQYCNEKCYVIKESFIIDVLLNDKNIQCSLIWYIWSSSAVWYGTCAHPVQFALLHMTIQCSLIRYICPSNAVWYGTGAHPIQFDMVHVTIQCSLIRYGWIQLQLEVFQNCIIIVIHFDFFNSDSLPRWYP